MYSSLLHLPHSAHSAESTKACGASAPVAGLAQLPAPLHCSCRVLLKQSTVHNAFLKQYIVYQKTKIFSAFLLFVVSVVAHREKCALSWHFSVYICFFWGGGNFATIKKTFSKDLSACIILVLDDTFVLNLTFYAFSVLSLIA